VLWWDLKEEQYLDEIRSWVTLASSSMDAERSKGKERFHRGYTEPSIFHCCAHDAPEIPGNAHEDTLRRVMLNVIGMHVARNFAEFHPLSQAPSARDAASLALHRARTAGSLLRHAVEKQGEGLSEARKAQLQVIAIYVRMNQVAVPSLFRKSMAGIRGVWFFDDTWVAEEVNASSDIDLLEMLAGYEPCHPDRLIIAANALVFASLQERLQDAVRAWEILCEECRAAADLATCLPSHERPLAESPDLEFLIAQNGGSTVLGPKSQVYVVLGKEISW
jgi:hypothetical protein